MHLTRSVCWKPSFAYLAAPFLLLPGESRWKLYCPTVFSESINEAELRMSQIRKLSMQEHSEWIVRTTPWAIFSLRLYYRTLTLIFLECFFVMKRFFSLVCSTWCVSHEKLTKFPILSSITSCYGYKQFHVSSWFCLCLKAAYSPHLALQHALSKAMLEIDLLKSSFEVTFTTSHWLKYSSCDLRVTLLRRKATATQATVCTGDRMMIASSEHFVGPFQNELCVCVCAMLVVCTICVQRVMYIMYICWYVCVDLGLCFLVVCTCLLVNYCFKANERIKKKSKEKHSLLLSNHATK